MARYCTPLSEWWTDPATLWTAHARAHNPISSASSARSVCIEVDTRQPTTIRSNKPSMNADYT